MTALPIGPTTYGGRFRDRMVIGLRGPYLLFYPVRMRLTWPLTGRAEETRLIAAAVADPDASGIAICGRGGGG